MTDEMFNVLIGEARELSAQLRGALNTLNDFHEKWTALDTSAAALTPEQKALVENVLDEVRKLQTEL